MVDVFEQVEEELRSDRYKRLARTWRLSASADTGGRGGRGARRDVPARRGGTRRARETPVNVTDLSDGPVRKPLLNLIEAWERPTIIRHEQRLLCGLERIDHADRIRVRQRDWLFHATRFARSGHVLRQLKVAGLSFRDSAQEDFVLGNIKARHRMVAQYA